jgi:formate hydrogenlyase subunit 3/multisubunit Na+/H+ antiporter MnhD subunit
MLTLKAVFHHPAYLGTMWGLGGLLVFSVITYYMYYVKYRGYQFSGGEPEVPIFLSVIAALFAPVLVPIAVALAVPIATIFFASWGAAAIIHKCMECGHVDPVGKDGSPYP